MGYSPMNLRGSPTGKPMNHFVTGGRGKKRSRGGREGSG